MKISITKLILEKMLELGEVYFDIFFPPNYSYTRISRRLFGLDSYPRVNPRTVSSLLSRLRRQGLVERRGSRKKSYWSLTKRGITWLRHESRNKKRLYQIPKIDGIVRLVIFDIPERERKKRDQIRIELMACNFEKLQKSVWMGYNPLPMEFVKLVEELNLGKKLHIFSIRDSGTIQGI